MSTVPMMRRTCLAADSRRSSGRWLTAMFLLLVSMSTMTVSVIDLNPQELQFVSDHLTTSKCDQLIGALHEKSLQIQPAPDGNAQLTVKPQVPCLVRLADWAKQEGQNLTFDVLALRLSQIGMAELSAKLSHAVLHETSEELHRFFLDDPFKDMIPTDSVMVDREMTTIKLLAAVDAQDQHETLFVTTVVLATICVAFCSSVCVCLACPRAGHVVCLQTCPTVCSSCYEVVVGGCARAWDGSRRGVDKYLLVAPTGGGGGFMV